MSQSPVSRGFQGNLTIHIHEHFSPNTPRSPTFLPTSGANLTADCCTDDPAPSRSAGPKIRGVIQGRIEDPKSTKIIRQKTQILARRRRLKIRFFAPILKRDASVSRGIAAFWCVKFRQNMDIFAKIRKRTKITSYPNPGSSRSGLPKIRGGHPEGGGHPR